MTIQPISELKNYNNLLDEVKDGAPIYLTKNGKGAFALLTISDADKFYKYEVNHDFKKSLDLDVSEMGFFMKDIEALDKEIENAKRDFDENGAQHGEEVFDEIRREINA